jgi:hypothetical protein
MCRTQGRTTCATPKRSVGEERDAQERRLDASEVFMTKVNEANKACCALTEVFRVRTALLRSWGADQQLSRPRDEGEEARFLEEFCRWVASGPLPRSPNPPLFSLLSSLSLLFLSHLSLSPLQFVKTLPTQAAAGLLPRSILLLALLSLRRTSVRLLSSSPVPAGSPTQWHLQLTPPLPLPQ